MKTYKHPQIVKLTKEEIELNIIDKTFEFTIDDRKNEIPVKFFIGKVINFDLTVDDKPNTLFVELLNTDKKIEEVEILNLIEIKYVC